MIVQRARTMPHTRAFRRSCRTLMPLRFLAWSYPKLGAYTHDCVPSFANGRGTRPQGCSGTESRRRAPPENVASRRVENDGKIDVSEGDGDQIIAGKKLQI